MIYISTGGGASLEVLKGHKLPTLEAYGQEAGYCCNITPGVNYGNKFNRQN
jgi:hypothetical protein